jgi:hypothetical protein
LPGHLEGWAEGAGGKDGDAVDEQFAQPRQPSDMHAQHRVDVEVGPEPEDLGDLGSLPPQGVQGAVQRPLAMPKPPGGVVQVPPVALGVDYEHPCGADHEVVDVGGGPGDGEVVENLVAVPLQWGEQAGGAPFAVGAAPPRRQAKVSMLGRKRSRQASAAAAISPVNHARLEVATAAVSRPTLTLAVRTAAIRRMMVGFQVCQSAARRRRYSPVAERPGRPCWSRNPDGGEVIPTTRALGTGGRSAGLARPSR